MDDTSNHKVALSVLTVFVGAIAGCVYGMIVSAPNHPNPNITPDTLTLILRNEGCEVWRFKDRGAFHYYANCREGITQATSAQGEGESELIETKYQERRK